MKKAVAILILALTLFSLTACGSSSGRAISFQGISMSIPSAWKPEKSNSDDYAVYTKSNAKGHDYKLMLQKTFGLLDTFGNDLDKAGAFFKEVTEDDASYQNPSDPVAGKFGGKYDMHTIECTYHVINPLKDGDTSYPCKLIRVYMGDHDVEIRFSSEKGDFEAFDAAIAAAVCG